MGGNLQKKNGISGFPELWVFLPLDSRGDPMHKTTVTHWFSIVHIFKMGGGEYSAWNKPEYGNRNNCSMKTRIIRISHVCMIHEQSQKNHESARNGVFQKITKNHEKSFLDTNFFHSSWTFEGLERYFFLIITLFIISTLLIDIFLVWIFSIPCILSIFWFLV